MSKFIDSIIGHAVGDAMEFLQRFALENIYLRIQ